MGRKGRYCMSVSKELGLLSESELIQLTSAIADELHIKLNNKMVELDKQVSAKDKPLLEKLDVYASVALKQLDTIDECLERLERHYNKNPLDGVKVK